MFYEIRQQGEWPVLEKNRGARDQRFLNQTCPPEAGFHPGKPMRLGDDGHLSYKPPQFCTLKPVPKKEAMDTVPWGLWKFEQALYASHNR